MNEAFSFHGFSATNQFFCVVNGDDILQVDYMTGQQKPIGKTNAAYSELEQTTTEYYNKLVELGVIVPEKNAQEVMAELQKAMALMAKTMESLSNEVKELKQNGHQPDPDNGRKNVSRRKPERSDPAGEGSDTGDA